MLEKTVKVAVISDSHVKRIEELPKQVQEALVEADAVIHLGDYTSPELLRDLREVNQFYGIIGNHDGLIGRRELKVTEVIELGGKRIGLIHGLFIPVARPKRIRAWFRKQKRDIDILLFGHNHLITNKKKNGVVLFNPGTVTGQFPATQATFGLLTLDGSIKAEIVTIPIDIPYRNSWILKVFAVVIRSLIRWLEAWPYIDFFYLFDRTKQRLEELRAIFRTLRTGSRNN